MEQLRQKKGFIIDMDGVIYHGNRLLPGAKEFVEWLYRENKQFLFLTNSSRRTPVELQKKLGWMGLDVDESHFYTSAQATASFIASQYPEASAYAVGEHGLLNALYDAGITVNEIDPDYVIIGEADNYNYDSIIKAVHFVNQGAKLIGTNFDLTGPKGDGIAPACRALVAPIELVTGKNAYFIGKPNPLMMRTAPGRPLRGNRHYRRPYGYRYCSRYRNGPGYRPGAHRRYQPRDHRGLPLPPPSGAPERGGDCWLSPAPKNQRNLEKTCKPCDRFHKNNFRH